MINDRIQFACDVLLELDVSLSEGDLFQNALKSARHRDETLRAAFLARKVKFDIDTVVTDYLKLLRGELQDRVGQMDADVEALMAVLEDEDIFTPADRVQAFVGATEISFSLRHEPVLELIERIWKPDYTDKRMGLFLWRTVLESSEMAVAKRLAARVPPVAVDLTDLAQWVKSEKALEVFVSNLPPKAIADYIPQIHDAIDQTSAWGDDGRDATMIVLLAHHVKHAGASDGWAAKFFDEILDRRRSMDGVARVMPQFAQLAKALGKLDDPRFFEAMKRHGLAHLDSFQLADLLVAGMPATLEAPEAEDEDDRVSHLLEEAELDFVSVLSPHMNEQQKEHFVRHKLPWKLREISSKWSEEKGVISCLDRNLLTELHDAGFDLALRFPDRKGELVVWLHERTHTGYSNDPRFVFVTLHALGVYPKDLRYGGMSPLHFAAFHDDVDALQTLVEMGHEVDNQTDASHVPHLDGDKPSDHRCTPLVIAAKHGKRRTFELLLELGADTGVKAGTGATLMQLLRDDEMKRILKSVRTTSTVRKAMSYSEPAADANPAGGGEMPPL